MRSWIAAALLVVASGALAEPAELDWLELMPAEDLKALEEMPDIEHAGTELQRSFDTPGGLRQQEGLPEVMYSRSSVAALNGREVRIGGYPVPLEADARGRSTEFFLVPYPGACIHVPPPPPNQIVLVRHPHGVTIEDIYQPLWVSGRLQVEEVSNALAEAVYSLQASAVRPVGEDEL